LYATAGSRRAVSRCTLPPVNCSVTDPREHEGKRGGAAPRQLSAAALLMVRWQGRAIFYVTRSFVSLCRTKNPACGLRLLRGDGLVDLKLKDDRIFSPLWKLARSHPSAPVCGQDRNHRRGFPRRNTPKSIRNNTATCAIRRTNRPAPLDFAISSPKKGEFGYAPWEKGRRYTGNTGVWTQITVDEHRLGLTCPVESPTSDF